MWYLISITFLHLICLFPLFSCLKTTCSLFNNRSCKISILLVSFCVFVKGQVQYVCLLRMLDCFLIEKVTGFVIADRDYMFILCTYHSFEKFYESVIKQWADIIRVTAGVQRRLHRHEQQRLCFILCFTHLLFFYEQKRPNLLEKKNESRGD